MLAGLSKSLGKTFWWITFVLGSFWFCSTTADCTAVSISYGVCRSFFGSPNARAYGLYGMYRCVNEWYGVTITLDFINSLLMLFTLVSFEDESSGYEAPPVQQQQQQPEKNVELTETNKV